MEYVKNGVKACTFCSATSMIFVAIIVIFNFVVNGLSDRSFVTSNESIYVFSPLLQSDFVDDDDKAALVIQWLFLVMFSCCMLTCSGCSGFWGCLSFSFKDDKNKIFATVVGICFCLPIIPLFIANLFYVIESFIFSFVRIFTLEEMEEEVILGMFLFHFANCFVCCICCGVLLISLVNIVWDVLEFLGIVQVGVVKANFQIESVPHSVDVESHMDHDHIAQSNAGPIQQETFMEADEKL